MPFLCCCSNKEAVDVGTTSPPKKDDEPNYTNNEWDLRLVLPPEADKEKALAESIYQDARQSLTPSMVYRPAVSCIRRVTFVLDTQPSELLKSHVDKPKPKTTTLTIRDTMVVKEELENSNMVVQPGYPGSLTEKELEACMEFRKVIKTKREEGDPSYYDMLRSLESFEDEAFALCRFLRSRQFNVSETLKLMDGNMEKWNEAKSHDFYPDLETTCGCPLFVLKTQVPILAHSIANNGSMVIYFQVGNVSLQAIDCLTNMENFKAYMWNLLTHSFRATVEKAQQKFPDTTMLGEVTFVVDLKGVNRSLFTARVMKLLEDVFGILNCFPEALSKLMIVNAPFFFSVMWMALKGKWVVSFKNLSFPSACFKINS